MTEYRDVCPYCCQENRAVEKSPISIFITKACVHLKHLIHFGSRIVFVFFDKKDSMECWDEARTL